jgi:hypothetical protein
LEVRLGLEGKEKGCSGIHKGMWFGISSILAVEMAVEVAVVVAMAVAMEVRRAVALVLVLVLTRVPAVIEVEGSSQ